MRFSTLTALAANTTATLPDSAPTTVAITLVPATGADKWPAFVALAVDKTVEVACCSTLTLIVWVITPPPQERLRRPLGQRDQSSAQPPLLPPYPETQAVIADQPKS